MPLNYEFNTDPEVNRRQERKPYANGDLFQLLADYLSIVPRVMTDSSNCFVLCSQQRDEGGISVNTYTSISLWWINRARVCFPPFPSSLHLPPPHLTSTPSASIMRVFIDSQSPPTLSHVLESASENECELTRLKRTERYARPKF